RHFLLNFPITLKNAGHSRAVSRLSKAGSQPHFSKPHLMKQGLETKGFRAQHNNILAAKMINAIVKSSLGPKGMDKMLVDTVDVEVTNDGYWMMYKMDLGHPVGKMLKEASWWMDISVGDGTTEVVVLACYLLEYALEL